jgi:sterol desaturase/sphingolipid hydroxylase (fatty acid hydroxylase superfamily)
MSVTGIVVICAVIMFAIERIVSVRSWPKVSGWWVRAALLNGVQAASVYLAGATYDGWLVKHRPWNLDGLGVPLAAVVGYVAITFVYYWWHRFRHEVGFLWRWFHQVHHSPQRIEIITSFYKHPFEILINGVLSSAILYWGVGVGPAAASIAVVITGVAEFVYHWNIRTPYWLGYLIQRPESHCVHHQEGLHSYNYADLPLWDIMFGTFRNPRKWEAACGFGDEGEHRLGVMLMGRDINRKETAEMQ